MLITPEVNKAYVESYADKIHAATWKLKKKVGLYGLVY